MPAVRYILGGSELNSIMSGLAAKAAGRDFTQPMRTVAAFLAAKVRECFDQQRAPDGTAWAPLKNPSKRRGANPKILVDTAKLFGSVQGRVGASGAVISEAGVVVEALADYASFHQQGTGRMPARPFLGTTPAMMARIRLIMLEWFDKQEAADGSNRGAPL